MDFLSNIRFSAFDYDLTPVHESRIDNEIFIEGSRWAHPREEDVKKRLKKIRVSYKVLVAIGYLRFLGLRIRQYVLQSLSWSLGYI